MTLAGFKALQLFRRFHGRSESNYVRMLAFLTCADVRDSIRSDDARQRKGFSLNWRRVAKKAVQKLPPLGGFSALLAVGPDGAVSMEIPDFVQTSHPTEVRHIVKA